MVQNGTLSPELTIQDMAKVVKSEECCQENKQSTAASCSSVSEGSGSAIHKSLAICSPASTLPSHDKPGKLLAEVLLGGLQGNRPVTLVGYSLGIRVIFKCMEFLAETESSAELVDKVVLLGAPIAIKD